MFVTKKKIVSKDREKKELRKFRKWVSMAQEKIEK